MRNKVRLFGIDVDALTKVEAIKLIMDWLKADAYLCRYVVTPNVDHVVKLQEHEGFREAYHAASLVLIDGKPVLVAARLLGESIFETVPGSDLTIQVLEVAASCENISVFLLGAAPGVGTKAVERIREQWPSVQVIGHYSPPFGFEREDAHSEYIIRQINECAPDLLIVGLGAPKQEIWMHKHRHLTKTKVALCVGAAIDFIAREKPRAPPWMRQIGMEWYYRLMSEPNRLAKRYAYDAWIFPRVLFNEFLKRKRTKFR